MISAGHQLEAELGEVSGTHQVLTPSHCCYGNPSRDGEKALFLEEKSLCLAWSCWVALRIPEMATRQCQFGLVPSLSTSPGSSVFLPEIWLDSELLTSSDVCGSVNFRMNGEPQANSDGRRLNQARFPVQTLWRSLSHFKFHSSIPVYLHREEPVVLNVLILELGPGRLGHGKY